jgi:hypothetical protein
MRYFCTIVLAIFSFLAFLSVGAFAQHQFKFSTEKTIVSAGNNPQHPDIAWDGNNFGVVYDDFQYGNNSSGVYLILVDTDGKVVQGPIKISTETIALYPKIVWTGNTYGILYTAGNKSGTQYNLKHYLARVNAGGNKLSDDELVGDSTSTYYPQYKKLLWTGSGFGIFYNADPNKTSTWAYERPLFCTADASGNPSAVKQVYDSCIETFDAVWDGKNFVVVCVDSFDSWYKQGVVQVLVLDKDGVITKVKSVIGFAPVSSCAGASIIPIKKKNSYLLAFGVYFPTETVRASASSKTGDLFASKISVKKSGISGLAPKNVTELEPEMWVNPTLIKANNSYYLLSNCGSTCEFAFAQVNDSGGIISSPISKNAG